MMPTTEELIAAGEWRDVLQAYLACITFVDAQVGKVLNALENSEYAENTIVVLWADHGYHLGEKNRFAKQALWERDTRTILTIKECGAKEKQTCAAPVQLIDMYPTLVEMCGLPAYKMADGHSLAPLLKNPKQKWEHPALISYGEGNTTIRDARYRLTQYEDGSLELYDMKKDPDEWKNLAKDKKQQERILKMKQYIPKEWAPLSYYSHYDINPYFKGKTKK